MTDTSTDPSLLSSLGLGANVNLGTGNLNQTTNKQYIGQTGTDMPLLDLANAISGQLGTGTQRATNDLGGGGGGYTAFASTLGSPGAGGGGGGAQYDPAGDLIKPLTQGTQIGTGDPTGTGSPAGTGPTNTGQPSTHVPFTQVGNGANLTAGTAPAAAAGASPLSDILASSQAGATPATGPGYTAPAPTTATAAQIAAWKAATPITSNPNYGAGWSPAQLATAENSAALNFAKMQSTNNAAAAATPATPTAGVEAQLNKYITDNYGAQQGASEVNQPIMNEMVAKLGAPAALAAYEKWADANKGNLYAAGADTHGTGDIDMEEAAFAAAGLDKNGNPLPSGAPPTPQAPPASPPGSQGS